MSSTKQKEKEPETVAALERRLGELRKQRGELQRELTNVRGAARGAEPQARKEAAQQIAQLKAELELIETDIAHIEQTLPVVREQEAVAAAEARQTAIARAAGSLANEFENDAKRALAALEQAVAAVSRWNGRHGEIARLRAEAAALTHRFGASMPKLPGTLPPALTAAGNDLVMLLRRCAPAGHIRLHPTTESDEHGQTRRTYAEVKATPGYGIICEAGLKPFPPVSPERRERRERQMEDEAAASARLDADVEAAHAVPARLL